MGASLDFLFRTLFLCVMNDTTPSQKTSVRFIARVLKERGRYRKHTNSSGMSVRDVAHEAFKAAGKSFLN